MTLSQDTLQALHIFARDEKTEAIIYRRLAAIEKDPKNKATLLQIAAEESQHCHIIEQEGGFTAHADGLKVFFYTALSRILGLTFAIKLMESGENNAAQRYRAFAQVPVIQALAQEEDIHEQNLIALIQEERLAYMSSVVLGLSDALVEFTGALAGFTFALSNPRLIALTGAITGIAAALSMASSEYLSSKSETDGEKHPLKAAVYTGTAYIFTVALLIAPFACMSSALAALGVMLFFALVLIGGFTFYFSVARGEPFKKRFIEMACLSFGVAAVSFLIGFALKTFTGIEA